MCRGMGEARGLKITHYLRITFSRDAVTTVYSYRYRNQHSGLKIPRSHRSYEFESRPRYKHFSTGEVNYIPVLAECIASPDSSKSSKEPQRFTSVAGYGADTGMLTST